MILSCLSTRRASSVCCKDGTSAYKGCQEKRSYIRRTSWRGSTRDGSTECWWTSGYTKATRNAAEHTRRKPCCRSHDGYTAMGADKACHVKCDGRIQWQTLQYGLDRCQGPLPLRVYDDFPWMLARRKTKCVSSIPVPADYDVVWRIS